MTRNKCTLICHSNYQHLSQIYTGFSCLKKNGLIDLEQKILKKKYSHKTRVQHLLVILNGGKKLIYDTFDGYEIDTEILKEVDFYFKRSFSPSYVSSLGVDQRKILPLGLNYLVYPDFIDTLGCKRSMVFGNRGLALRMMKLNPGFYPTIANMESVPNLGAPSKVLFMVRAWDPSDAPDGDASKVDERNKINEMRAECIVLLKKEFGDRFYGGFIPSDYAAKRHKNLIIHDPNLTIKKNYLSLLTGFPICIATTGLHGSIGWKFAEYVAFSKAIVTEKLNYKVPGSFEVGKNYLEFSTAEDCVNHVSTLFSDHELRNQIMQNNYDYYQSFVRPDIMIFNTLKIALSN